MTFLTDTWESRWCPDHSCLPSFLCPSLLCSFLLLHVCNELKFYVYHNFHVLFKPFCGFLTVGFREIKEHVYLSECKVFLVAIVCGYEKYLCVYLWLKTVRCFGILWIPGAQKNSCRSCQSCFLSCHNILSLAPFLFWRSYLKRQESVIPGRFLECLIIRSSKQVSCGIFSAVGRKTKLSFHFLTCSTLIILREKQLCLQLGLTSVCFFLSWINFCGLFSFFQNSPLCFQV